MQKTKVKMAETLFLWKESSSVSVRQAFSLFFIHLPITPPSGEVLLVLFTQTC